MPVVNSIRLLCLGVVLVVSSAADHSAAAADDACSDAGTDSCAFESDAPAAVTDDRLAPSHERTTLEFFWGVGCPHCEDAKPFVDRLEREPGLRVLRWEVRRNQQARAHFVATMNRLGATAAGVPTFVVGDDYLVGFEQGSSEGKVRRLIERARDGKPSETTNDVELPLIGRFDVNAMSLPTLTVVFGLLDGINPCAMWVLLVLLGLLMHVKSRTRLLLLGGTFVLMSGVVYFTFMSAWSLLFGLIGLSRAITITLGLLVFVMGLINLKELFWFKRGPSLTIPERAKPGLFRRMRRVVSAASLPAALLGVAALAFVVNLVELGCTLGLPAVYTRILSSSQLSAGSRYAYLALYNSFYIVPLALVVALYAATLHRLVLSERGAKVLKGVSGTLLVLCGAVFVFWPELLG